MGGPLCFFVPSRGPHSGIMEGSLGRSALRRLLHLAYCVDGFSVVGDVLLDKFLHSGIDAVFSFASA